jgi:hypothetical protein
MIPRSLKIGAHDYKIRTALKKDMPPEESGNCDSEKNVITILRHAPRSRKIELILHESLHAMLAGHDFQDEEPIIVILGEALTQFLANNPHFITEAMSVLSDAKKI